MKVWSNGQKVMVIFPTVLIAMAGLYGYLEWDSLPSRALIAGSDQTLDHTIGAILQSRSKPTKYLLFSAEDITTVLAGAQLRFTGSTRLVSMRLSADTGRVTWRNGKFDNHEVPGLFVHVQATIRGGEGPASTEDTLMLKLPGLTTLGERFDDDVRISYNGNTPRWGDSVMMQRYAFYSDQAAVNRARTPYLVLAVTMALLTLVIVVRVVLWTIS